jgi:hypothetical protein
MQGKYFQDRRRNKEDEMNKVLRFVSFILIFITSFYLMLFAKTIEPWTVGCIGLNLANIIFNKED